MGGRALRVRPEIYGNVLKKKWNWTWTYNSERLQMQKNIDLSGGFGWRVFQNHFRRSSRRDLCVLHHREQMNVEITKGVRYLWYSDAFDLYFIRSHKIRNREVLLLMLVRFPRLVQLEQTVFSKADFEWKKLFLIFWIWNWILWRFGFFCIDRFMLSYLVGSTMKKL
jgi:hypothetical protein